MTAERVALVIGNGDYKHGSVLPNPPADARDVAAALQGCGFSLVGGKPLADLSHEDMEAALAEFAKESAKAKVSLFFFAGHGFELDANNYLVPVDAEVEEEYQVKHRTVALDEVLGAMAEGGEDLLKIVILDCCRDNPLGRGWTRTSSKGLAAPKSTPGGTILLFAAAPGKVASDGRGENSPFTAALRQELLRPGVEIETVFKRVGAAVQKSTGKKQEPWINSSFYGSFAFVSGGAPGMTQAEIERRARELAAQMAAEAAKEREASGGAPTMVARPTEPGGLPGGSGGFSAGSGMEGRRAGEVREIGGIEMVWCPARTFLMGSPASEADRGDDERQHEVTLTKGFWLAKTECTQGQWERVMGSNPSGFEGSNKLPVETVSWNDVQGWLAKMNEKDLLPAGWKWELPTEAQWEYACRAGTTGRYGGSGDLSEMGWYSDNSGNKTHEVGTKRGNDWGLQDMHGNVWEWCRDWYGDYASGTVSDPTGATSGGRRVLRGGCWLFTAQNCRSANRDWSRPDDRYDGLGFRPALVPSPSQ